VTLSIGVAADVPGDHSSAEWLLSQADEALYAAKALGRNRTTSADAMLADLARRGRRKPPARSSTRAARK
jgi:predicted signal transduction protein with EAL and GGDEF domain